MLCRAIRIGLWNAFGRYLCMVLGQLHNYISYMLWNEVFFSNVTKKQLSGMASDKSLFGFVPNWCGG